MVLVFLFGGVVGTIFGWWANDAVEKLLPSSGGDASAPSDNGMLAQMGAAFTRLLRGAAFIALVVVVLVLLAFLITPRHH